MHRLLSVGPVPRFVETSAAHRKAPMRIAPEQKKRVGDDSSAGTESVFLCVTAFRPGAHLRLLAFLGCGPALYRVPSSPSSH